MRDAVCIGFGLLVGLWVAANVWFYRYAVGYKAGVKYCTKELEPLRVELALMGFPGALSPTSALRDQRETRH